jgi:ribosome-binding protein aMBF1 (putative translation factor)
MKLTLDYPELVRELRRVTGWTQGDPAEKLDPRCTARTIVNWEAGRQPSRYYRRRLDIIAKRHLA